MTELREVLEMLRLRDVKIRTERGELLLEAPRGALSAQELEAIRTHKVALIDVLQRFENDARSSALIRRARSGRVVASYAQQRVWVAEKMEPGSTVHHVPVALKLQGELDRQVLQAAVEGLIERHEVLRTTFIEIDGEVFQEIHPSLPAAMRFEDVMCLPAHQREAEIERYMDEEASTLFDLARGPLIRLRLLRVGDDEHILLVTLHHIATDGWSMTVLIEDMTALYSACREGRAAILPPLDIQYADYTLWQRDWLKGAVRTQQLDYWRQQLDGAQGRLDLPMDGCSPRTTDRRGAAHEFQLSPTVSTRLIELARTRGCTPFMVLVAMFHVLLSRVSGQSDITIATPVAGRSRRETERLIGFFVNIVMLRVKVDEGMTFGELLRSVRSIVIGAYTHQDLPVNELIAELRFMRVSGDRVGAGVAFSLENPPPTNWQLSGLSIEMFRPRVRTANVDLGLHMQERDGVLCGRIEYAIHAFSDRIVIEMGQRLVRLAEQVIEDPDRSLFSLDLTLPQSITGLRCPVSIAQQVMWAEEQLHPDEASFFNLCDVVEFRLPLDYELFAKALQRLIERTTALRLQFFVQPNGTFGQEILASRSVPLTLIDFSRDKDPKAAAFAWVASARRNYIDPTNDVPFSYALLKLSDQRFIWYRHHHHLIVDMIGLSLLTARMMRAYAALLNGEEDQGASDFDSYVKYLHLDYEYRYSSDCARDRQYWMTRSCHSASVTLSVRATAQNVKMGCVKASISLSGDVSQRLSQLAADLRLALPKVVIAAVALYLHRVSGRDDLCIGLQTHGRIEPVTRGLVATCASILPITFTIPRDVSVRELLPRLAKQVDGGLLHGRLHGEGIRRLWRVNPAAPPPFSVVVNVLPQKSSPSGWLPDNAPALPPDERYRERDLRITIGSHGADVTISLSANSQLYETWEIEAHLSRLKDLLEEMSACESWVSGVDVLCSAERRERQLLSGFSQGAARPVDRRSITQLVEDQVRRTPHAVALSQGQAELTYSALNGRANQLARYLRRHGVGANRLVALCLRRSLDMVVGLLAVLKAGGAYVPLDPDYPAERLATMLEDSGAKVLLQHEDLGRSFAAGGVATLPLDRDWDVVACEDATNLDAPAGDQEADSLAYVIFTSGSTGRPKGSRVHRRGFQNLLEWYVSEFGFSATDRVLVVSSFSFDLTQKNFIAPLLSGGCVCLAAEHFDPDQIIAQIARAGVTTMNLTPSALYSIIEAQSDRHREKDLMSLRLVVLGGESIDQARIRPLVERCPQLRVVNTYGPTECTDIAASYVLDLDVHGAGGSVPIGRPIQNARIYILDESLRPVHIGGAGEICIGGVGVGSGYVNKDSLTAERFVVDKFAEGHGTHLYRSGDLGRWRTDGNIEFLGRNDGQVKLRGFRVELGEIEAQLARHPQVAQAAAVVRQRGAGDAVLIAYITSVGQVPDPDSLRRHLRQSLPEFMIPSAFVSLDSLPLSANGKLDRRALASYEVAPADTVGDELPRGELEEAVACIWKELLQVSLVCRSDSFFDLGGHSLLAMRMVARIRSILDLEVSARQVFENPTLARFADSLIELVIGAHDVPALASALNKLEEQSASTMKNGHSAGSHVAVQP